MEDLSGRLGSPVLIQHQGVGVGLCEAHSMAKKRSLPFQPAQQRRDSWNPKAWEWDSARFVATPIESNRQPESHNKKSVALNLVLNSAEEAQSLPNPPNKRLRSGSPNTPSYPMCQVDNCKENLTSAKDYHRRHKVCEVHSKASKALVGKQMQRFCQQCSRFHPLSEFDEGKRSCRRRLAGHNKRRRKTQPEDTASQSLLPGSNGISGNSNMDIVNLLTVLASAQGNNEKRSTNFSTLPDKDQIILALSKINSLPLPANIVEKLPISGSLNGSSASQHPPECKEGENISSPSTLDLIAALSSTSAGTASDAIEIHSQRSSQGSDSERSKLAFAVHDTWINLQKVPPLELSSVGGEKSSTSYQSPEDLDSNVREIHPNIPLQLFTSPVEDDCTRTPPGGVKYFSSESSNPSAGRSPSSSPPVVQKLFPLQDSIGSTKPDRNFASMEENRNVKETKTNGCITTFQLFGGLITGADSYSIQSSPYRTGYTSSSGSDHSPASLNSDAQDRTGRIMFKLFDKDPSHLPGSLRTQIYHWLSNIPSEMESHIRPGCVVLSLYLSMPSSLWEQLEENLYHYVNTLVKDVDPQFWGCGRFLVRTNKQLVSHRDGNIRACKSGRGSRSPKLTCVSPLAAVGGQEISLTLRGTNLNFPGTKIYCTHAGGYRIRCVETSTWQGSDCKEIILHNFMIHHTSPSVFGRFFIEVENGVRGTSFPIIVADNAVCGELRCLESDISEVGNIHGAALGHGNQDFEMARSKEVVHFLNELGWIFQRKCNSSFDSPDLKIIRFKFLLIFSVEHDFTALVKTLLDILLEINLVREGLASESLKMLLDLQLLSRAVKRKCKDMVDLLINFSVTVPGDNLKKYIFTPNLAGPGGITPLHLAACTANSDDVVDALTSDPQEIGLRCWNSLLDENGLSPNAYALMRNNNSYNNLVSQKLAHRENGQVSVSIGEIDELCLDVEEDRKPASQVNQGPKSCSMCAAAAVRHGRQIPGSQGLLYRPYIHSMLAIAAVCVCVCVFFRGAPDIGSIAPFKWENLDFGPL